MKKFLSVILCVAMLFSLAIPVFAAYDTPYADSQFFDCGDYSLHYRVKSAENAKGQIMMLHGFAESTYNWEPLAAFLAENGYTCVLVDLPDFGYSSRETGETEMLPREDIIHALMTDLSDEPWYLAGHSMGGYIALAVAQKYPDSVKNLLLYGTAGNDGVPARALMSKAAVAKVVGAFMELMGRCTPVVRLLLHFALQDRTYASGYDLETLMAPFRIKGTGAGAVRNFSMLTDTDYDAVRRMPPILFVNGSKDKVIADRARTNLRAALPDGSVDYVVSGGGHMFIENYAAETAALTLDFLAANG
ncbi:MAG: alpha/beta hydrolase [Clostridia bacterium]|nr:alpha/beta hydrolase [Clostridia bacterium]